MRTTAESGYKMVVIPNCEFRRFDTGRSAKTGNEWYRIAFEDSNAYNFQAYLSSDDVEPFRALRKGDYINLTAELTSRDGNLSLRITGYSLIGSEID